MAIEILMEVREECTREWFDLRMFRVVSEVEDGRKEFGREGRKTINLDRMGSA